MKLLLLFMLTASPASAVKPCAQTPSVPRQPCAPDYENRKDLMVLIGNATGYYADWAKARKDEEDLRDWISLGLSTDYEAWQKAVARAAGAEDNLQREFIKISAKTQKAYRVGPNSKSGPITGGLFDKDRANWNPVLVIEPTVYEVRRPNKSPVYLRFNNNATTLGATLDDGRVIITIEALRRAAKTGSPASLAATFEHEGRHFDDLVGSKGFQSRAKTELGAYRRELEIAEDISLPQGDRDNAQRGVDLHAPAASLQATEEEFTKQPYIATPGTDEYPYIPEPDTHLAAWGKYQERLARIAKEQKELHDEIAAGDRDRHRRWLRDALNDPPPPPGATSHDGCGGTGFWAGDVYMPAMPCPGSFPQPTPSAVIPAVPAPSVPPVSLPPPVRAVPSLSGLAERICASPAAAHSQPFHDDYGEAWYSSSQDVTAMSICQREVFLVLMRIRQQGSVDYNSAYFQAFAESLNMPHPPVFTPPEPEVDLPVPPGPAVPDCLRAEGRRCIRWRR